MNTTVRAHMRSGRPVRQHTRFYAYVNGYPISLWRTRHSATRWGVGPFRRTGGYSTLVKPVKMSERMFRIRQTEIGMPVEATERAARRRYDWRYTRRGFAWREKRRGKRH